MGYNDILKKLVASAKAGDQNAVKALMVKAQEAEDYGNRKADQEASNSSAKGADPGPRTDAADAGSYGTPAFAPRPSSRVILEQMKACKTLETWEWMAQKYEAAFREELAESARMGSYLVQPFYHFPQLPIHLIPDTGISVGEIIAHRAWRYHGGILKSTGMQHFWTPGEEMHGEPEKEHQGVHCLKSLDNVLRYFEYDRAKEILVIGKVKLWGLVIEHENGYRAEHAKIHSLDFVLCDPSIDEDAILARLRRRYGVEQ